MNLNPISAVKRMIARRMERLHLESQGQQCYKIVAQVIKLNWEIKPSRPHLLAAKEALCEAALQFQEEAEKLRK